MSDCQKQPATCVYDLGGTTGYPSLADCEPGFQYYDECNDGASRCANGACPGCFAIQGPAGPDGSPEYQYYCPGMSHYANLRLCNGSAGVAELKCSPGRAVFGMGFQKNTDKDNIFSRLSTLWCATPSEAAMGDLSQMEKVDTLPSGAACKSTTSYDEVHCPAGTALAGVRQWYNHDNSNDDKNGTRRLQYACLPFEPRGALADNAGGGCDFYSTGSGDSAYPSYDTDSNLCKTKVFGDQTDNTGNAGDDVLLSCYPPTDPPQLFAIYPQEGPAAVDGGPDSSYGNFFVTGVGSAWTEKSDSNRMDHISITCGDLTQTLAQRERALACCMGTYDGPDSDCTEIGVTKCVDHNTTGQCTGCDETMGDYCADPANTADPQCSCINSPLVGALTGDGTPVPAASIPCYDCACAGLAPPSCPAGTGIPGYQTDAMVAAVSAGCGDLTICTQSISTDGSGNYVSGNVQELDCDPAPTVQRQVPRRLVLLVAFILLLLVALNIAALSKKKGKGAGSGPVPPPGLDLPPLESLPPLS